MSKKQKKIYAVPVRVTGVFRTKVSGKDIDEVYDAVNELTGNADFGVLADIDWDAGEPETFDSYLHEISDGGDGTLNPEEQLKALVKEMIDLADRAWDCGDAIYRLLGGDDYNDALIDVLTEIQEHSLTDLDEAVTAIKEAVENDDVEEDEDNG